MDGILGILNTSPARLLSSLFSGSAAGGSGSNPLSSLFGRGDSIGGGSGSGSGTLSTIMDVASIAAMFL
jgi:hypothetical protein